MAQQSEFNSDLCFEKHLNTLDQQNQKYYKHVKGECKCAKCTCGKHKCRQRGLVTDYKKDFGSTYQEDFKKYDPNAIAQMSHKPQLWNTFSHPQKMDFKSTYGQAFPPKTVDASKKLSQPIDNTVTGHIPFAGYSSYQNQFLNWGNNGPTQIRPQQISTVIKDLPFIGKTTYGKDFVQQPANANKEQDKLLNLAKRGNFSAPYSSDFPFLGETASNSAYRPFKTFKYADPAVSRHSRSEIPNFKGQFTTIQRQDYNDGTPLTCIYYKKDQNKSHQKSQLLQSIQ